MINKKSLIFVTGHNGMVGSSVVRRLKFWGYKNILIIEKKKLDLRDQREVNLFFKNKKIDAVINAAAMVGGINANNKYKAEFIYNNLVIQNNIIHSCYKHKIKDLIFLGSSCIYPKKCKQPIKESYLLNGYLEKTNEPYAIAKIAGIKMCESYNFQYKTNFKCLLPCNIYGPNDNYNLENSHFASAIISKVHNSMVNKKNFISLWGNGRSKRELLYVDDLADACILFLRKKIKENLINIGSEKEITIINFAKLVMAQLKTKLKIKLDRSKPSGTPRKILDCSIAKKYGWKPKVNLKEGIKFAYQDFLLYKNL
jgi:GDP-L-fucose synthase